MKNKLFGISICLMMLATLLPITAMTTSGDSPGIVDHTTVRGIVLFKRTTDGGKNLHFFAVRLHYTTVWLSGEHEYGLVKMEPVTLPSDLNGIYGNFYIFASFRGSLNH